MSNEVRCECGGWFVPKEPDYACPICRSVDLAALRAALEEAKRAAWYAFVDGAKWWQFHANGATMFPSERDVAEEEAKKRYPFIPHLVVAHWQDLAETRARELAESKAEVARLTEERDEARKWLAEKQAQPAFCRFGYNPTPPRCFVCSVMPNEQCAGRVANQWVLQAEKEAEAGLTAAVEAREKAESDLCIALNDAHKLIAKCDEAEKQRRELDALYVAAMVRGNKAEVRAETAERERDEQSQGRLAAQTNLGIVITERDSFREGERRAREALGKIAGGIHLECCGLVESADEFCLCPVGIARRALATPTPEAKGCATGETPCCCDAPECMYLGEGGCKAPCLGPLRRATTPTPPPTLAAETGEVERVARLAHDAYESTFSSEGTIMLFDCRPAKEQAGWRAVARALLPSRAAIRHEAFEEAVGAVVQCGVNFYTDEAIAAIRALEVKP